MHALSAASRHMVQCIDLSTGTNWAILTLLSSHINPDRSGQISSIARRLLGDPDFFDHKVVSSFPVKDEAI
jgi:hypothetical protein